MAWAVKILRRRQCLVVAAIGERQGNLPGSRVCEGREEWNRVYWSLCFVNPNLFPVRGVWGHGA